MKIKNQWTMALLATMTILNPAFANDAKAPKPAAKAGAKTESSESTKGPKLMSAETAVIKTSEGDIEIKLFAARAPKTVDNFVGLATGKKDWRDPKSGEMQKGKSLYVGTPFHRVIPDFMIQGGDPTGTGMGGPGYQFEDEVSKEDKFDKPGILAMANAGPGTNGSQFFITVAPTPWLAGKHTIFGEVTKGMDVVNKISTAPRDGRDKPNKAITIQAITVK